MYNWNRAGGWSGFLACVAVGVLLFVPDGTGADSATSQPGKVTQPETSATPRQDLPVYMPPKLGAPGGRKGGAARGSTSELIVLSVLAPDHTALTARDQPILYWYISKPTTAPIEFTLIDERTVYPRLEVRLRNANEAGLQSVRLSDYAIRLEPGVKYEWTVSVLVDPMRRSKDILAGGVVMHMALPNEVADQLTHPEQGSAPDIYARAGFWYDAVASISELIEATPQDPWLRKQRAALLEQADLPEVAAHDKGARPIQ